MKHYSGNYFCTKSNWKGDFYDANNLVVIDGFEEKCGNEFGNEDFKNLLGKKKVLDKIRSEIFPDMDKQFFQRDCYYLKAKVREWLDKNVKDTQNGDKGWCCGNDEYNSHDSGEFSLFFYRRKDALSFIKTWSSYKKPTETYSQNTYIAKKLNIKTGKLVVEKRD
jgi:hypothetical protein